MLWSCISKCRDRIVRINCLEMQTVVNSCFKTKCITDVYNYWSVQNADCRPGTKYNNIYKYTTVHSTI